MTTFSPAIILVEPQLSENIGMTARAMANCNLSNLRLINPRENHLSDKAISASSGAEYILENAVVYNSTQDAIKDLHQVFATTARHRDMIKNIYTAEQAAKEIASSQSQKSGILFGRERTGLENDDVSLCNAIIEIPLNPNHCSLNLSQAVLLVGYEIFKQSSSAPSNQLITNKTDIATKEQINSLLSYLDSKLEDFPILKNQEKAPRIKRNLHNIFTRSQITEQEINTLFGVFKHLTKD